MIIFSHTLNNICKVYNFNLKKQVFFYANQSKIKLDKDSYEKTIKIIDEIKNKMKIFTCGLLVLWSCSLKKNYLCKKIQIMDFKEILKKFNNKYIIATLIFAVVIIFVDQYNLFYQINNFKKLKKAKSQVEYYEKEIKEQQETLDRLHRDSALMERIAREKYMMKRDNEVIYVIEAKE